MTAVVSIVGNSESGKTTLIEKLIRELKLKGYRVATIKHTPHGMTFDQQGKDSWRYLQAGSEATAIVAQDRVVLIKSVLPTITLDEVVRLFGNEYDIILAEGFKRDSAPKILVHRKAIGPPPGDIKNIIAIAADEPLEAKVKQFSLEDASGLVSLLEKSFLKRKG